MNNSIQMILRSYVIVQEIFFDICFLWMIKLVSFINQEMANGWFNVKSSNAHKIANI